MILEDWRELSRSEMFTRVIIAVDASHGEAQVAGDETWVRRCEEHLFPFLEDELEKAELEEALSLQK